MGLRLRWGKRKKKKRLKPKDVEHSKKKMILLKQDIPSKHINFPSLSTNLNFF
jgi:hypothetical protein